LGCETQEEVREKRKKGNRVPERSLLSLTEEGRKKGKGVGGGKKNHREKGYIGGKVMWC